MPGRKISERARDFIEAVLAREKFTRDDIMARGWAEDEKEARQLAANVMRLLHRDHADIATGFVPGRNGEPGHWKAIEGLDEAERVARRRLKLALGWLRETTIGVRNAPIQLKEGEQKIYAAQVRPYAGDIVALALEGQFNILMLHDPRAGEKALARLAEAHGNS